MAPETPNNNVRILCKTCRAYKEALEHKTEYSKMRRSFVASLNHDINTSLNIIIGFSELMLSSEYSVEERLEFARVVHDNSIELNSKINNIINNSQFDQSSYV